MASSWSRASCELAASGELYNGAALIDPDGLRGLYRSAHHWDAERLPFTAGLRRDLDAVVAGLTLDYNSGAVEGTVNRIKRLKTAMYGRAKPDLLRKLILLA
jgi:transposase